MNLTSYEGFSRLQADINVMKQLLATNNTWHHLINLCGRDFPVKTNDQIEMYLNELGNKSDIGSTTVKPGQMKYERVSRSQVHTAELSEETKQKYFKLGFRTKTMNWSGVWLRAKVADHMDTYVGSSFSLVFSCT